MGLGLVVTGRSRSHPRKMSPRPASVAVPRLLAVPGWRTRTGRRKARVRSAALPLLGGRAHRSSRLRPAGSPSSVFPRFRRRRPCVRGRRTDSAPAAGGDHGTGCGGRTSRSATGGRRARAGGLRRGRRGPQSARSAEGRPGCAPRRCAERRASRCAGAVLSPALLDRLVEPLHLASAALRAQ